MGLGGTRRRPLAIVMAVAALAILVPVALAGNGSSDAFYEGNADDGSPVFFQTEEQLVGADNDDASDVYKRESGQITLVSGGTTNDGAFFQDAAADGSPVFFETMEQLTGADNDGALDVYKRESGQITLVSDGDGAFSALFEGAAADGSPVFFSTNDKLTSNDVEGDCPNTLGDCRNDVYKRQSGQITLVSTGTDGSVGGAFFRGAAEDGSPVYFVTLAQVVDDNDTDFDIYKKEGGQVSNVSDGTENVNPSFEGMADDGDPVFFGTTESLTGGDTDGGFFDIYRNAGGAISLISGDASPEDDANFGDVAADGDPVYWETREDLTGSDDDDGSTDVYKNAGGVISLVSDGEDETDVNFNGIADDGTPVAFTTTEQLVDGDNDGVRDVYKANSAGEISQVSSGGFPVPAFFSAVAGDGSPIFFHTAERLTAADDDFGIDLYGRESGFLTLLSGSGDDNFVEGEGFAFDGDPLYFSTDEQLVGADNDNDFDVYKNAGGVISLVSG